MRIDAEQRISLRGVKRNIPSAGKSPFRILENINAPEAFFFHLKTEHFQKYKQGTLHMVKSLSLPTMKPLDPETMSLIFKKK